MSTPCTATPGCKNNAPYGYDSKGSPVAIFTGDGKPACASCYHETLNKELEGRPVSRHLPLRGCLDHCRKALRMQDFFLLCYRDRTRI